MREVKYVFFKTKFWNPHDKVFVNWEEIVNNLGYTYDLLNRIEDNLIPIRNTGLKDKNGVEIYEGDIILQYQEVIWKEKDAMFGIPNGKYELGNYSDRLDFEVIGNVYQNRELLTKD